MGIVSYIPVLVFAMLSGPIVAQDEQAIAWDASRKLSWSDFRGKPFETAWAAATTASGISYEYTGKEKDGGYELDFKVGAFFYPDKSWYQPKLCNQEVLAHEQLHFDISELFARKMRKELSATRFTENAREEVKAIYNRILRELSAFQSHYDHDTNYSRDRDKQLAWQQRIASMLYE